MTLFPHFSSSAPSIDSLEGILKSTLIEMLDTLRANWFFNPSGNYPTRHKLTNTIINLPKCRHENPKLEFLTMIFKIMEETKLIEHAIIGLVAQKNIEETCALIISEFLTYILKS